MKKLNLKFMFTVAAVLLVFTGTMALSAYAVPAIQAGYGITGLPITALGCFPSAPAHRPPAATRVSCFSANSAIRVDRHGS